MEYQNCKFCGQNTKLINEKKLLLQCGSCGLIFYQQSLKKEETVKLYSKLYEANDGEYKMHILQQSQLRQGLQPPLGYNRKTVLEFILKNKPQKIAEIGAGVGVTANYLQKKNIDYTGFEIDGQIANTAHQYGLNIKHATFEALTDYKNNFGALLAFEVLEHIDALKFCMAVIHESLKPSGYLGFTVPNYNKRNNYRNDDPFKLYQPNPPVHVNFFTTGNIQHILAQSGFKILMLAKRPFPDLAWKKAITYKNLMKVFMGRYEGSTIMCVAQKI